MDGLPKGCSIAILIILILVFVGVVAFQLVINPLGNQQTFTATIEKTYIDNGNTYYVLKMEDGRLLPYSNEDNWYFGKFNSGDFQVKLEVGKTYEFFTSGYRVPFRSLFPNIVRAELIK
jgi:hypothetical protein